MRALVPTTALFIGILAVAGCSAQTTSEDIDAEALVRQRCTRCHSLDRIRLLSRSEELWRTTIERMRDRGAKLNDAEADAVAEFLAGGGGSEL